MVDVIAGGEGRGRRGQFGEERSQESHGGKSHGVSLHSVGLKGRENVAEGVVVPEGVCGGQGTGREPGRAGGGGTDVCWD